MHLKHGHGVSADHRDVFECLRIKNSALAEEASACLGGEAFLMHRSAHLEPVHNRVRVVRDRVQTQDGIAVVVPKDQTCSVHRSSVRSVWKTIQQ
jgi:hypothetical protein